MEKRGSIGGFVLVLLGGLLDMLVAVNMLFPSVIRWLLALYFTILGALTLAFAFRMRQATLVKRASIVAIFLGVLSLNPLTLIGGIVGLGRT